MTNISIKYKGILLFWKFVSFPNINVPTLEFLNTIFDDLIKEYCMKIALTKQASQAHHTVGSYFNVQYFPVLAYFMDQIKAKQISTRKKEYYLGTASSPFTYNSYLKYFKCLIIDFNVHGSVHMHVGRSKLLWNLSNRLL